MFRTHIVEAKRRDVRVYVTADGREPFTQWLVSLKDRSAKIQIEKRITRLREGLLGEWKPIAGGNGIKELIIDFGPGYRLYCAEDGPVTVVLLCAGEKSTQRSDIRTAKKFWKEYNS